MKRVYHRYEKWEEFHAGMWRTLPKEDEETFLNKAIDFTGDAELYGQFMVEVVLNWPFSCEHNLTCRGMNRQAWIGHAACCLATKSPEYITRQAWHTLSEKQQNHANLNASIAIELWEEEYLKCLK